MLRAIEVTAVVRRPLACCREVLLTDALAMLDGGRGDGGDGPATVSLDLGEIGAVGGRHQVVCEIDERVETHAGIRLHLRLRPAEHELWLPAFEGDLDVTGTADRTDLRFAGSYRMPFGQVGRFGDGVVGHRVARLTLDAFLATLAGGLDGVAGPDGSDRDPARADGDGVPGD